MYNCHITFIRLLPHVLIVILILYIFNNFLIHYTFYLLLICNQITFYVNSHQRILFITYYVHQFILCVLLHIIIYCLHLWVIVLTLILFLYFLHTTCLILLLQVLIIFTRLKRKPGQIIQQSRKKYCNG